MMRMGVQFTEIPPVGQTLLVNQRRYDLVDIRSAWREDGTTQVVLRWRTDCPDCRAVFIIDVYGLKLPKEMFDALQSCEAHSGPGGTTIVED